MEKLDQYFTSVREIERKSNKGKPVVNSKQLTRDFTQKPGNYRDKIETLMDLMVLAWDSMLLESVLC